MKRTIAVFDFDGTLTTKDTFVEFIKFTCGIRLFYVGFLIYSPLMVLMKMHLYPNWRVKQKVFSFFFRGWQFKHFEQLGVEFSKKIDLFQNEQTIKKLEEHINHGDTIYVISASILEWVLPWCKQKNISMVIATEIEIDERGIITGNFLTKNCYGQEKVNRFLELEPDRGNYYLYAYGDSLGDREIINFADKGFRICTKTMLNLL